MPVSFIPFSSWMPDGGNYGLQLARAENVLPVHGTFRSAQQKQTMATYATDAPVTGAYVHIFQQARQIQFARPYADTTPGIWVPLTGSALWDMLDEASANDGDYMIASGAPSSEIAKLELTTVSTPSVDTDHYFRWRYLVNNPSGAWTITVDLMQGVTVISTDTATGSADGGSTFTEREKAVATAEAANITDYADLFLRFTATVPGSAQFARPDSDSSNPAPWVTQAGSATDIYTTIDESVASDSDYITSNVFGVGGSSIYQTGLGNVTDPRRSSGHVMRWRRKGRNAGLSLTVRLKQGTTTIASKAAASLATSFTDDSLTLSSAEADAITDYNDLRLEFEASYPSSVASTVGQFARPNGETENTLWTATGAATTWEAIDEVSPSDADFASNPAAGISVPRTEEALEVSLSSVADPQISSGHVWRVRSSGPGTLRLLSAGTIIREEDVSGVTITTRTFTLTATEADAIASYSSLSMRFIRWTDTIGVFEVQWAELEVPEPRQVQVSFAELEVPSSARVQISWAELQVPDPLTSYKGDEVTIFAGTKLKLLEADSGGFTDRSRATGYGASNTPGAWHFCSFGNDPVATNYTDPVQYRPANTGLFADLITSADKPKARFCATVRNFLVLGDINFAAHFADEVWWSAFENHRDFQQSATTLADFQRILSRPGQVMGLVGGEYGVVFKRNSIHSMMYAGDATIFRFDDVSRSIGTPCPNSIVTADGLIYFWDGATFRRTDGLAPPEPIGHQSITEWLGDTDWSDQAMAAFEPASIMIEDQLLSGHFDQAAGLLIWIYQHKDQTSPHSKSRAVIYNPREDRWAFWNTGLLTNFLIQRPNSTTADRFALKATIGFDWAGTDNGAITWFKFSSPDTYEATFETKIFSVGDEERGARRIKGIRPVWSLETDLGGSWPSGIQVTLTTADDPRLLVGSESESYTQVSANEGGWFPVDRTGVFFKVQLYVPSINAAMMRGFKGVHVEWEPRGQA